MLLSLVLGTTCAAQEIPAASKLNLKTYNIQSQTIVEWDEDMVVPLKETPVLQVHEANKNLPDDQRRAQDKLIIDLMREARENQPE